ncbi:MAG: pyridoxamine 5'-phosphate oxidase [Alphaproteobacteria bacterium]|nr:pyridoxamine 5'-phosphate oxidase [Alphaproteobacteria bacterium]
MQGLTSRLFDDDDTDAIDPYVLFEEWYAAAQASEPADANAMALATVDADGLPDARTVLMNGRSPDGIVFYSNAESDKGRQLAASPRAALLFHWKSLFRQVRLRGPVEEVAASEATAYFHARPRGSQIGAHASEQSRPLTSREDLLNRMSRLETRLEGVEVPRPDHWRGFRVRPIVWEFWRAGEFRLHDRVRFERSGAGWARQRLNP